MVYRKLLARAGGGTGPDLRMPPPNSVSILIGLGGLGIDALQAAKTLVSESILPTVPAAALPRYDRIRFLGIDTDGAVIRRRPEEERGVPLEAGREFIHLAPPLTPAAAIHHERYGWLDPECLRNFRNGGAGAGAIRQVGRLLMMEHSRGLYERLRMELCDATVGMAQPHIDIYLFSGLCGGTGSGIFLDVCYMLRSLTRGADARLFGLFFLPQVAFEKIPAGETALRETLCRNGSAALQELEHCMGLPGSGAFTQEYQNGLWLDWDRPPVDDCLLAGAEDAQGRYADSRRVISAAAVYVEKQIEGALGGPPGGYLAPGAAVLCPPRRLAVTWLASELFGLFDQLDGPDPEGPEAERLLAEALEAGGPGGFFDGLLRMLTQGACPSFLEYYPGDAAGLLQQGDGDFKSYYADQLAKKRGQLQKNAHSMKDKSSADSLTGRIRRLLEKVIRDPAQGPVYAYCLLEAAGNHRLSYIIDELIKENDIRLAQARHDHGLVRQSYEEARQVFLSRTRRKLLDSDARRYADYEAAARNEVASQATVEVHDLLDDVLTQLKFQLRDVARDCHELARVWQSLSETFLENELYLRTAGQNGGTGCCQPLIALPELWPDLRQALSAVDVRREKSRLVGLLLERPELWPEEKEEALARFVSDFFAADVFSGVSGLSLTGFLQAAYPAGQIVDVSSHALGWGMEAACPLAPPSMTDGTLGVASTVFVPAGCLPLMAAAGGLHGAHIQAENGQSDRVTVLRYAPITPQAVQDYAGPVLRDAPAGTYLYTPGCAEGIRLDG